MDEQSKQDLAPYELTKVKFTGIRIDAGAYGIVEEVQTPGATCAAKRIHDFFLDTTYVSNAASQFVKECKLMATLRHPHIIQFIGVCSFPDSRLPALIMERMITSLHNFLDPETAVTPDTPTTISLIMKCSILHDVAGGLAYLHEHDPPIIHRDLSARNILLNSGMVAKIADLGVARIVIKASASMTKIPGASVYMPPEALPYYPGVIIKERKTENYDTSIDIFSFGVVAIFTLSQKFPCNIDTAVRVNEDDTLHARSEFERRQNYIKELQMKHSVIDKEHHLFKMIEGCLHNNPKKRLSSYEVLHMLEQARSEVKGEDLDSNTIQELVKLFQTKHIHQMRDYLPFHTFNAPYGVAFNNQGDMIISEWSNHRVSVFKVLERKKTRVLQICNTDMKYPAGIAVDNDDCIYVTSQHKLQKFDNDGKLKNFTENCGQDRKLNDPRGLAINEKGVYVVDRGNHCIQVFNFDLTFAQSIGSRGKEKGEFNDPFDIKFDKTGKMYVAEYGNKRVQVFNVNFEPQACTCVGEGILGSPTGLHITDDKIYVSDFAYDHVRVFNTMGRDVKTLASRGVEENNLRCPYCITSHNHGGDKIYLYVCDFGNNRILVFVDDKPHDIIGPADLD